MIFDEYPMSVDTLARTLWGEARGCGIAGMSHVANVIINRVDSPRWWGDDVISVCRAPEQFSCWNPDDPNHDKLLTVDSRDKEFSEAVSIAFASVGRTLKDATDNADSYYAITLRHPPFWAVRATKTFSDGFHVFLRVDLPAENGGPEAPNISVHTPVEDTDLVDDDE